LIRLTDHARRKFEVLRELGLKVEEHRVLEIVRKPSVVGRAWKDRFVATGPLSSTHVLRVIFEKQNGNITVVTFYPARRARYESKLR
jgi:hypothetical protein